MLRYAMTMWYSYSTNRPMITYTVLNILANTHNETVLVREASYILGKAMV
jgi:hypothetical protein